MRELGGHYWYYRSFWKVSHQSSMLCWLSQVTFLEHAFTPPLGYCTRYQYVVSVMLHLVQCYLPAQFHLTSSDLRTQMVQLPFKYTRRCWNPLSRLLESKMPVVSQGVFWKKPAKQWNQEWQLMTLTSLFIMKPSEIMPTLLHCFTVVSPSLCAPPWTTWHAMVYLTTDHYRMVTSSILTSLWVCLCYLWFLSCAASLVSISVCFIVSDILGLYQQWHGWVCYITSNTTVSELYH